jgi:hypothetical protein
MPQRTERSGKGLFHMLFLGAALWLLSAVVRRERKQLIMATKARRKKVRVAPRRIAASLAFATLFFAGAALSAGAGNGVTSFFDQESDSALSSESTSTELMTTEDSEAPSIDPAAAAAAAAEVQAPAPAPADSDPVPSSADVAQAHSAPVSTPSSNTQSAGVQAALSQRAKAGGMAPQPSAKESAAAKVKAKSRAWAPKSFLRQPPVVKPDRGPLRAPDRDAEADEPNVDATVWLYRALPIRRRRRGA